MISKYNNKWTNARLLQEFYILESRKEEVVQALKLALESMQRCDERQHIKRHSDDSIYRAEQALKESGEL